ncbi:unnamed protein product [marine sediment metagenome]|uniref:Uncharacterized protein n=1 Tax=marine sediment metagenome TaxID=412755 RepID=X0TRK0_9ZZZZ
MLASPVGGQALESGKGVVNLEEGDLLGQVGRLALGDHSCGAVADGVGDELLAVAVLAWQGYEQVAGPDLTRVDGHAAKRLSLDGPAHGDKQGVESTRYVLSGWHGPILSLRALLH